MNEAMRDWVTNVDDTFYIIGTVAGPHPYPMLVRDFQCVIGREAREQAWRRPASCRMRWWPASVAGRTPSACSIRSSPMSPWPCTASRRAAWVSSRVSTRRRCQPARPVSCTAIVPISCRTRTGRSRTRIPCPRASTIPVSARSTWLKDIGRVNYVAVNDDEALAAFHRLTRIEGIMPALETAHALAYAEKLAATMTPQQHIVVNLSGRGDKDILTVAALEGIEV
jgi:tryptophan synthase beta chain